MRVHFHIGIFDNQIDSFLLETITNNRPTGHINFIITPLILRIALKLFLTLSRLCTKVHIFMLRIMQFQFNNFYQIRMFKFKHRLLISTTVNFRWFSRRLTVLLLFLSQLTNTLILSYRTVKSFITLLQLLQRLASLPAVGFKHS